MAVVEPETKPVPLIVSVKAAPPTVPEGGFRLVTVGAALMVKVEAAEAAAAPGVVTVTLAVPAVVIRLGATVAVNFVALP